MSKPTYFLGFSPYFPFSRRSYLKGEIKYTNNIRELLNAYRKGLIPKNWKSYYITTDHSTFLSWLEDFNGKLQFFLQLFASPSAQSLPANEIGVLLNTSLSTIVFDLQKMKYADSLLMASRQQSAKLNHWSLEEMELFLDIAPVNSTDKGIFDTASNDLCITGLILQGAKYDSAHRAFIFSEELEEIIPRSYLKWRLKSSINPSEKALAQHDGASTMMMSVASKYDEIGTQSLIKLPIYYNDHRRQLMYSLYVPVLSVQNGSFIPPAQWAQRSVAIVLQTSMQ